MLEGGPHPGPDRGLAGAGGPRGRGPAAVRQLRISAQRYNEPADYDRLADATSFDYATAE